MKTLIKKRKPLSLIRLYKLAQKFSVEYPKKNKIVPAHEVVVDYLSFVSKHWQDTL